MADRRAAGTPRLPITAFGAVADSATINPKAIQAAIEQAVARGGGTIVVPPGIFLGDALFVAPRSTSISPTVLRCSTDMRDFPVQRTRIEGQFEDRFDPALINAEGGDGLVLDDDKQASSTDGIDLDSASA